MSAIYRREFLQNISLAAPLFLSTRLSAESTAALTKIRAAPWPEAEALFHQDPRWLGGDGVYSIDLGNGRVLWMFGDSFVSTSPAHKRSEARIVRNSIAIQTGYDPATATMRFFWAHSGVAPDAFFVSNSPKWFWPAHGIRIGSALLIFLSEMKASSGGLGFEGSGWKAILVDNPDADPDAWHVRYLESPNRFSMAVGSSILVAGDFIYAYSHSDAENGGTHNIFLARFPLDQAAKGILTNLEWYNGGSGWELQSNMSHGPPPLIPDGQTEFNVYAYPPHFPFLEVQTEGFPSAVLSYRTAESPLGRWYGLQQFYRPPEASRSDIQIYSAKLHPMLIHSGADFTVSYSTNSSNFNTLVHDSSLYFPRFVKAHWQ